MPARAKSPDQTAEEAAFRLDSLDKEDAAAAVAVLERLAGKELQLHAKLADIAVIADRIPKRGTAPSAMGGYGFVQVGDAADFIRRALGRRHISMAPTTVEKINHAEHMTRNQSVMTTVELLGNWTLTDGDTDEQTTFMSYGVGSDTGDKFSGKAMTSLMKYALLTGFQLSTGEDSELNDTTDKTMAGSAAPTVEQRAGRAPAAGGRQQNASQPQSAVIGTLLRQAKATTTPKAIALLQQLTGKTIEVGEDPNAALSAFIKEGLSANEAGKLVHDLRKHVETLNGASETGNGTEAKEQAAEETEAPAGHDSSPGAPAGDTPDESLEAGPQA